MELLLHSAGGYWSTVLVPLVQAEDEDLEQVAINAQGPAVMLWSLIRWLEQELPDVRQVSSLRRGGVASSEVLL